MMFNKLCPYKITCSGCNECEKHLYRTAAKQKCESATCKSGGKSKLDR